MDESAQHCGYLQLKREVTVGIRGISIGSLLVVLAIILIIFGTKRLRNMGEDLGGALKGFRKGMKEGEEEKPKDDS